MRVQKQFMTILAGISALGLLFMALSCENLAGTDKQSGDFVAVTDITGLPTQAVVGVALTLSETVTVTPAAATNTSIAWSVTNSPAAINGSQFTATAAGTVTVAAVISKGKSQSEDYVKNFDIQVYEAGQAPTVIKVEVSPATATVAKGGTETFSALVSGDKGPSQNVTWTITTAGVHTGTTIDNTGKLTVATGETQGSLTVRATSDADAAMHGEARVTVSSVPGSGEGISAGEVAAYLAGKPDNTALSPYTIQLAPEGGTTSADINMEVVELAVRLSRKYVTLDLSVCTDTSILGTFIPNNSTPWYVADVIWDNQYVVGLVLPDSITSIGDVAFDHCSKLRSITIPDRVTSIGMYAFSGCFNLKNITIPNGVTGIGEGAFYYCTSLTSVTIPGSVKNMGLMAFAHCESLQSLTILNGVTGIGEAAFTDCTSLTSVTIPGSVKNIGQGAFSTCTSLKSLTILNGVTSIGKYAFTDCTSLTSVTIPGSVTSIGEGAFINCTSLKSITLPDNLTSIDKDVFWDCTSLASITIPGKVTSIGEYAFYRCTSLTSETIPSSVTSIGEYAFAYCTSLTSVSFAAGSHILEENFSDQFPFPGDLRDKYLAAGGGAGRYTRPGGSDTWTK
jgi:hypothetical protein